MITSLSIENFKGFGERVTIPFKPITLLFGPNSAGKSSIIHALHYVREILNRRNVDAGYTQSGGNLLDLGGFRSFVHRRELDRPIRLRVDFKTAPLELPEYESPGDDAATVGHRADTAWVELETRWSILQRRAYVCRYSIGINGEHLGSITYDPGRRAAQVQDVNAVHPIFAWAEGRNEDARERSLIPSRSTSPGHEPPFENVWKYLNCQPEPSLDFTGGQLLLDHSDALPEWGKPLRLFWEPADDRNDSENIYAVMELQAVLSQLIVGPGEILRDFLNDFRYVGPIRETPPRDYRPHFYPDITRWPNGMAAWDALAAGSAEFVAEVARWLSREDRLATGYSVRQQRRRIVDEESPLIVGLRTGRAFDEIDADDLEASVQGLPELRDVVLVDENNDGLKVSPAEVGVGISQILPVAVALLAPGGNLIGIEQPELHIHPRIQVALGDLLIQRSQAPSEDGKVRNASLPTTLLIETHSEHLILRLMKRIKQTTHRKLPMHTDGLSPDELVVLYVERSDGAVRIHHLEVDQDGEFLGPWPDGFFEERGEELFG